MERRGSASEKQRSVELLDRYLQLGNKFRNSADIQLSLLSTKPSGEVVEVESVGSSTAIQCYAKGRARMINRQDSGAKSISEITLDAGHHTTRQHANFTFQISGVSRSVTHDVLHATPFYNSEQQSQRYVEIVMGSFLTPDFLSSDQLSHYRSSANYANESYFSLLKKLKKPVEERVVGMNPQGGWSVASTAKRLTEKSQKLSQEIARYVLPIGQQTTMFHTLSELQLLRLFRASNLKGFTNEAKFVIASMIDEVSKKDTSILDELRFPVDSDPELDSEEIIDKEEFDGLLGDKRSVALDIPKNLDTKMLGKIAKSPLLADVFESAMFDPQVSKLRWISLAFATCLSHTADSQRQRHRRTSSSVSDISSVYDGSLEYILPLVIKESPDLSGYFDDVMEKMFENVNRALEMGIPTEIATLLLPNAYKLRVKEQGDLYDWIHRWKQRLCLLAQEEIFFISVDQVESVAKKVPELTPALLAPCGIRQNVGVRPRCPEGTKWCGQPVYNWRIDKYREKRII